MDQNEDLPLEKLVVNMRKHFFNAAASSNNLKHIGTGSIGSTCARDTTEVLPSRRSRYSNPGLYNDLDNLTNTGNSEATNERIDWNSGMAAECGPVRLTKEALARLDQTTGSLPQPDEEIVLDTPRLQAPSFQQLRAKYPRAFRRRTNTGSEANSVSGLSVRSGLSLKSPCCYSLSISRADLTISGTCPVGIEDSESSQLLKQRLKENQEKLRSILSKENRPTRGKSELDCLTQPLTGLKSSVSSRLKDKESDESRRVAFESDSAVDVASLHSSPGADLSDANELGKRPTGRLNKDSDGDSGIVRGRRDKRGSKGSISSNDLDDDSYSSPDRLKQDMIATWNKQGARPKNTHPTAEYTQFSGSSHLKRLTLPPESSCLHFTDDHFVGTTELDYQKPDAKTRHLLPPSRPEEDGYGEVTRGIKSMTEAEFKFKHNRDHDSSKSTNKDLQENERTLELGHTRVRAEKLRAKHNYKRPEQNLQTLFTPQMSVFKSKYDQVYQSDDEPCSNDSLKNSDVIVSSDEEDKSFPTLENVMATSTRKVEANLSIHHAEPAVVLAEDEKAYTKKELFPLEGEMEKNSWSQ